MKNAIQVAWVIDEQEIELLQSAWVEYLWFPLRLPVNIPDQSEEEAKELIKKIKPPYKSVVITYLDNAQEILDFCEEIWVNIIQLHWKISKQQLEIIKKKNSSLYIIKSLVVRWDNIEELENMVYELSPVVDAFITDTFDPKTWAEWATGKTHDWNISKKLVSISKRPVIIAGGLNPTNVRKAIQEIKPAWVDAHTWLEWKDWRKDKDLVLRFVEEARIGFESIEK